MKISHIGVFDSGRGGEITTTYLRERFPDIQFTFLDDQAHAPYGEKTVEEIHELAVNMVNRLTTQNVDLIVVACHTISSTCFETVQEESPVPLISVNKALLTDLLTEPVSRRIGLLATSATVKSGWFARHITEHIADSFTVSVACPQLATAIDAQDEAWIDRLLDEYLGQLPLNDLDTLALACTHYPVVIEQIRSKLERPLQIHDARFQVGKTIENLLQS
jgi:glutamate racemase